MKKKDSKIYLASQSPRRRELLRQIGVDFEVLQITSTNGTDFDIVNEDVLPNELPHDYVKRISKEKAKMAWSFLQEQNLPLYPILTADTTVTLDNQILGKPQDREEAFAILKKLSGKTHKVLTCVTIFTEEKLLQNLQISEVTFALLSDQEIQTYCNTEEPYDKAGAYGIQGLAAKFISYISGSYSGIVGLPLFETTQLLREAGIEI